MLALLPLLTAAALAGEAPDLTGTWRIEYAVVTRSELPVVGHLKSASRSTVLATVRERDGELVQRHQACGSVVEGGIVKSRIPEPYLRSIPVRDYPLELSPDGAVRADTGILQTGYDPSCPAVPDAQDDPCVRDTDGDGQPGVTILAKAPLFPWVEVYVAQRNHLVFEGKVVSVDRVEGQARMAAMHTSVIGASNRLFARSPVAEVVPEESVFQMTRMPEGSTCADALAL